MGPTGEGHIEVAVISPDGTILKDLFLNCNHNYFHLEEGDYIMNKTKKSLKLFMVFLITLILSGCSYTINELISRENLGKLQKVKIETQSTEGVTVSRIQVFQLKNVLEVSGEAELEETLQDGHFIVTILGTENNVLLHVGVKAERPFKRNQKLNNRSALLTFRTKLPLVVPEKSVVRVEFHKKEVPGLNTFKCVMNERTFNKRLLAVQARFI
jgi:hypothetical protein